MDLNKTMIIGRLTRDPEGRATPQGQNVTSFSVATNFIWTDSNGQKQEKVEYHNIVAWRKLADICNQYLKKGSKIYIEGRLQTRSWQDQSGGTRYRTEIIAENMIMLDRAGGNSGNDFKAPMAPGKAQPAAETPFEKISSAPSTAAETPPNNTPQYTKPEENQEEEIRLEDIPF